MTLLGVLSWVGLAEAAAGRHALGPDPSRALAGAGGGVALMIALYFQSDASLRQRRRRADDSASQVGAAA